MGVLATGTLLAVPAKRISRTITQPDGSTVTVTLTGDEWFHSYVTSDGLAVVITPEDHAVYLSADGPTQVYAHEQMERQAAEQQFLATVPGTVSYSALRAASPRMELMKANAEARMRPAVAQASASAQSAPSRVNVGQNTSQVPHIGTAHVPIILVQYTDVKFRDGDNAKQVFEDFFNTGDKSCYKYFQDMSQGQYDPQFHVLGPVTVSNNRKYYGGSDYWGNDERPGAMVKEALQLVNATEDMSIYDNDGDGEADVVVVLYAGVGQASSGVAEAVWPCQWDLTSSRDGSVVCDGVRFNKFAVFNELNGSYRTQIDGPGTFCHEFSHCLGLPDFYETTYGHGYFGMGDWSLMDHGCYNDDGYTPIGYSAYEKAFMGWIDLTDATRNTHYSLPVLNDPADPQSAAVALVNSSDANECFILESRAKVGWDQYIPAEGMLITHVTYSKTAWDGNSVNNNALQRMTPVPADNVLSSSSLKGDLWPYNNNTEFTNTSTPAAKVNTGGYLSMPVTDIARDSQTGAVSFWVDREPVSPIEQPEPAEPVGGDLPGSFIATWNDVSVEGTGVTYTLQYWPKDDSELTPFNVMTFSKADNTWTPEGGYVQFSKYISLGYNGLNGTLSSPTEMMSEDGVLTAVVNAKQYASDTNCPIIISLSDADGQVVGVEEFTAEKDARYFSVAFAGLDDNKLYSLTIANRGTSQKRILLYHAMVFTGNCAELDDEEYAKAYNAYLESAAAPSRAPEVSVVGNRTTVTGISETSYTVTGLEPESTYCYRVKAVPDDPDVAKESFWSPIQTVDLAGLSGVVTIAGDEVATGWRVSNGELLATPGSRLYSVSGVEVQALAPGRFAPAAGAYILVAPGCRPVKIVL